MSRFISDQDCADEGFKPLKKVIVIHLSSSISILDIYMAFRHLPSLSCSRELLSKIH